MFWRNKKSKQEPKTEIVDKDIQLIKFLKSANLSDLTLGKIDHTTYEVNNAEIESMGLRMAERRIYECEKEVYSQDR